MSVGRSLKATRDYMFGTVGGAIYGGAIAVLIPHSGEAALLGIAGAGGGAAGSHRRHQSQPERGHRDRRDRAAGPDHAATSIRSVPRSIGSWRSPSGRSPGFWYLSSCCRRGRTTRSASAPRGRSELIAAAHSASCWLAWRAGSTTTPCTGFRTASAAALVELNALGAEAAARTRARIWSAAPDTGSAAADHIAAAPRSRDDRAGVPGGVAARICRRGSRCRWPESAMRLSPIWGPPPLRCEPVAVLLRPRRSMKRWSSMPTKSRRCAARF